jgi:chromosome segregation ATPase
MNLIERITALEAKLANLRKQREELLAELASFKVAVAHVTEDGKGSRSFSSSEGWAMVHREYLADLEQQREELLAAAQKAADQIRVCDYTPARSTLLVAIASVKGGAV